MQVYKITEGPLTGRIIIPIDQYEVWICATPTVGQYRASRALLTHTPNNLVELSEEKWVHPHLPKVIKKSLETQ